MKSFLSEDPFAGNSGPNQVQYDSSPNTARVTAFTDGKNDGNRSGDLRATVSRRFMSMLRAHDRARIKMLSANPRPGKAN